MQTHHTFPLTINTVNPPVEFENSTNKTLLNILEPSNISNEDQSTAINYPAWTIKRGKGGVTDSGIEVLLGDFKRNSSVGAMEICGKTYKDYLNYWKENTREGVAEAFYDVEAFKKWLKTLNFTEEHLKAIETHYCQSWTAPIRRVIQRAFAIDGTPCSVFFINELASLMIADGKLVLHTKEANFGLRESTHPSDLRYLPGTITTESEFTDEAMVIKTITVSNQTLFEIMHSINLSFADSLGQFNAAERRELQLLMEVKDQDEMEGFLGQFFAIHRALVGGNSTKLNNVYSYNTVLGDIEKTSPLESSLNELKEVTGEAKLEKTSIKQLATIADKLLKLQRCLLGELFYDAEMNFNESVASVYERTVIFYQSLIRCQHTLLAMKEAGKAFVGNGIALDIKQFEENQFRFECAKFSDSNNRVVQKALQNEGEAKNSLINIRFQIRSSQPPSKVALLKVLDALVPRKFPGESPEVAKLNAQLQKQKNKLGNLIIWRSANFIESKFKLNLVRQLVEALKLSNPNQAQRRLDYYQGKRSKPWAIIADEEIRNFEKIIDAQTQFDKKLEEWKENTLDLERLIEVKKSICQLEILIEQWGAKLTKSALKKALVDSSAQFQQCFADFETIAKKIYSDETLMEQIGEGKKYLSAISPFQFGLKNEYEGAVSLEDHNFAERNPLDPDARLWALRGKQKEQLIETFPHSLAVHVFKEGLLQPRGLAGFRLPTFQAQQMLLFRSDNQVSYECPLSYWQKTIFDSGLLEGLAGDEYVDTKEQNLLDALAIQDLAALRRIYAEKAETSKIFIETSLFYQRLLNMTLPDLRKAYAEDIRVKNSLALNADLVFELAKANINIAIVLFENKQALKNAGFSGEQKQELTDKYKNNSEFFKALSLWQRLFLPRPTAIHKEKSLVDEKEYRTIALKSAPKVNELALSTGKVNELLSKESPEVTEKTQATSESETVEGGNTVGNGKKVSQKNVDSNFFAADQGQQGVAVSNNSKPKVTGSPPVKVNP